MAISNTKKLNLDRIDRTNKLQTLVALANASYRIKDKKEVVKVLKYTLELYKDPVRGSDTGAGTYSGESMDQFQSKYTPGLEFGIWKSTKNDKYELSSLALKLVEGNITSKYYLSTVLMNFIQIINNKVIHPFMETLEFLKINGKDILTVEDIKSIQKFNIDEDRNNAKIWLEYLKDSLFFDIYNEKEGSLIFNKCFDINEVIKNLNKEYLDKSTKEVKELFENQENWAEYLGKENSIISGLKLNNINVNSDKQKKKNLVNRYHNRLIYGAPGTGKSYLLEKERKEYFDADKYERVTFYPDYSYGQFVGVYKPISEDGNIKYKFILGPFLRLLIKALKNEEENYLLIIEEINRANAAAVFGDIFQLLDRDSSGKSEYLVSMSEDIIQYLKKNEAELLEKLKSNMLYIPNNFYIWATMNSADQGVTVLDSAFKRRFDDYKLMEINENSNAIVEIENGKERIDNILVNINGIGNLKWNDFRVLLNNYLMNEFNIKEDKLIGPFFIKPDILSNNDKFQKAFIDKLLMYLVEDVLNHKKQQVFISSSISELKERYRNKECIFKDLSWIEGIKINESEELVNTEENKSEDI